MIRFLLFAVLAASAAGYAFWVYRHAELRVPGSVWLALARAATLVLILALLFDPRLPGTDSAAAVSRWVLLDASLSMSATADGSTAWDAASARADALAADGWIVITFGESADVFSEGSEEEAAGPEHAHTRLAPALERAAEAGVSSVQVLSDLRFEDAVAIGAALERLPLDVTFEAFGGAVTNSGISSFDVADAPRPEGTVVAEIEVHGVGVDSADLTIRADGIEVVTRRIGLPAPGLRNRFDVSIPVPEAAGRIRYSAVISAGGDGFPSDDEAVAYATVGHEEGAVVLVSLRPDWEPRYMLPVLEEVTGLPAAGFLRVGAERFVPMGPALARSSPVDSATVRRALADAQLVVIHGLSAEADAWGRGLVDRVGRSILMVDDAAGAAIIGFQAGPARGGEWYLSGDIPSSPLAGEMAGAALLGLPPLTRVLVPTDGRVLNSPLNLQLRGTGPPEGALFLDDTGSSRRVIALASGFWRWAMRGGAGQDAYRRMWSGVAGWLLADETASAPEPRPAKWVFARDEAVSWLLPGDSSDIALEVTLNGAVVVDTVTTGSMGLSSGRLAPGRYAYEAKGSEGEPLASGSFDVTATSEELIPASAAPTVSLRPEVTASQQQPGGGRPLRTYLWPYVLAIMLLCGEWVARRRTGLR